MPIIPKVGRNSIKTRLVVFCLYVALILGATTMVYPFLVMLATGTTSTIDQEEGQRLIPLYVLDTPRLYAKFAEDKFSDSPEEISYGYSMKVDNAKNVEPPEAKHSLAVLHEWRKFLAGLAPEGYDAGFRDTPTRQTSLLKEHYQAYCRDKFHGDIDALNRRYAEENGMFETVEAPREQWESRDYILSDDPKLHDWMTFKRTLPIRFRIPVTGDRVFERFLNGEYHGEIAALNREWKTKFAKFQDISLGDRPPANAKGREQWYRCLRELMPYRFLEIRDAGGKWRRADDGVDLYNLQKRSALKDRLASIRPDDVRPATLEMAFAKKAGIKPENVMGIPAEEGWLYVKENQSALRTEFAARNFRFVLNYILLHGRAVWVTVLFCAGAVLTQLIVNPLCAYALSRFPMRSTGRLLLFLLATMAFPAEVAMIPSFLLLKQLGLLNTYWALILPGAASGFAIFLLKGFFDSLPKELYEAGTMDGASEMTMFARVTIPLSKPIFAVIALQSFLAAYGAFMYAFLVCQDQKMWTIMVWLYELQVRSPKFVTMAALTLTAIPTLLVFLFAQNVIMRGIILPSEK